jgi:hypothetical protein
MQMHLLWECMKLKLPLSWVADRQGGAACAVSANCRSCVRRLRRRVLAALR